MFFNPRRNASRWKVCPGICDGRIRYGRESCFPPDGFAQTSLRALTLNQRGAYMSGPGGLLSPLLYSGNLLLFPTRQMQAHVVTYCRDMPIAAIQGPLHARAAFAAHILSRGQEAALAPPTTALRPKQKKLKFFCFCS